jgi:hypothetical protein
MLLFCVVGALLLAGGSARAADTIFWSNYESSAGISFAAISGGGGGNLDTSGAISENTNGIALNPAAGKVFWITAPGSQLSQANLGGGGGTNISVPGVEPGFFIGLAVDPVAGRAYWGNNDSIADANLDGSGGGVLDTSGATIENVGGVAVDPTRNRIFWGNSGGFAPISFANLSGGGGGDLNTTGALSNEGAGIAVDTAGGRVYWADYGQSKIFFARLDGTGGGQLTTTGATVDGPYGVAVDPIAGRLYWANEIGGKLSYANLDGSGGGDLDTTGATVNKPAFPSLLKTPSVVTPVSASGSSKPGATLSCIAATWAPDLTEAFLFRAPTSTALQWLRNGQPIAGASEAKLKATQVGSYSCQSTATNQAGPSAASSPTVAVFKLGKLKVNAKNGTATLSVQVPGAGVLTVSGKQIAKQKRTRKAATPATLKVTIKAKGKAKKALAQKGKAKIKIKVAFVPQGGSGAPQTKSLTLKEKPGA